MPSAKVIAQCRKEYEAEAPAWARGYRLRAMVEWEAGKHKLARELWAKGTKLIGEMEAGSEQWHIYDEASWLALIRDKDAAVAAMKKAIEIGGQRAAEEADEASDFYPLRGYKPFEELLAKHLGDDKRPLPRELRWKRAAPAGEGAAPRPGGAVKPAEPAR